MTLEPYALAILPVAHLTDRFDPFDRYWRGNRALEASYRAVVNTGVRAYQPHTYLGLVEQYFGPEIRRLVREHQRSALDGVCGTDRDIEHVLELIVTALGTQAIRIASERGDIEVPIEMNVALVLLLDAPLSPDFVSDPARRMEQIGRIGKEVDWCFAECLSRGREAIVDAFGPMFAEADCVGGSIVGLRGVGSG